MSRRQFALVNSVSIGDKLVSSIGAKVRSQHRNSALVRRGSPAGRETSCSEIWTAPEYQRAVFHALDGAGRAFGIGLFGSRAQNSLRLEKGYGSWSREYRPHYGPLEAGLERFVAYGKDADFVGKAGALAEREHGGRYRLRTFVVEAADADAIGDEPIWFDGSVRGWVTSGGYAHGSGKSVAPGYVPKEIAAESEGFGIEILGRRHGAEIARAPLFDAHQERLRG